MSLRGRLRRLGGLGRMLQMHSLRRGAHENSTAKAAIFHDAFFGDPEPQIGGHAEMGPGAVIRSFKRLGRMVRPRYE
jgi:hypothetical protein